MKTLLHFALCFCLLIILSDSARILTVVPFPSISHQVVFRPLTQELAKRGHDVTIITTDPAFPKGRTPENLTEIDIHDLSYETWRDIAFGGGITNGNSNDVINQLALIFPFLNEIVETQIKSQALQSLIKSKAKFDLLIIEACIRPAMVFSHVFKDVPVILMSSLAGTPFNYDVIGAPTNPTLLYPTIFRQRLYELNLWEKVTEIYNHFQIILLYEKALASGNEMIKRIYGEDVPTISELENNVDMLLLNVHPIWDHNRPVPPSVVYIGGIHQKPSKDLSKDLQTYLDSSKNGVIYISFGTNVSPSTLPPEKIQMMVNVFSRLPYDVLWKWDKDELPGKSENVKIFKWLPQSDLLKHPKIKLFITQGGLQSTDEAIIAEVPLIGIPLYGDQWYNVEQYVHHKIGLRLDMDTLTEEVFLAGVNTVLNDQSYRQNIQGLRALMHDQPESGLSRAVWWTEHVLRHGSGRHLRAPAANLSYAEYLDSELMALLAIVVLA